MTGDSPAADQRALSDLRVLDLTGRLGQYCGRLLASLGADVIRIEPPGGGEPRGAAPWAVGFSPEDRSLEFWFHNLRKRSLVLDLDTEEGQALLARLAAGADVLLESFEPGYLGERGLGPATLLEANPALIHTSISPFGQEGPYANFVASDITLMALGGQMWLCGYPDAPPVRLTGNAASMQAGLHASYATMIALYERDRSGLGQHVDLSTQDCIATAMETAMQFWDLRHELRTRTGAERRSPAAGPYPCKDGMIQWMAPATGNGWENLVEWLREDGVFDDEGRPEWGDPSARQLHLDEFDAAFIPWLMEHTVEELTEEARRRHLTIGPSRDIGFILADPHLEQRGFWAEISPPSGDGVYRVPGAPLRMSATPLLAGGRPPRLGEDTEVLAAEPARTPGDRIVENAAEHVFPLEGLRVVDFSWFGAGPMGTKVLADHGAEVIRIESEYRLDGLRRAGPKRDGHEGPNQSGYYNDHNSSKLSCQMNVNSPGGQELVRRLVAISDVVIDNFNPGIMARWGLSYEELVKIKPDIIVVNMPAMGLSGPRRDEVAFGSTLTGMTALNHLTRLPNQMPVGVGTNYPDYASQPYQAISAILAALHHRDRTGEGQHIELAQYESTLQLIGPAVLDATVNGAEPGPIGNRDPQAAPHAAFRAGGPPTSGGEDDRWIAIACFGDGQWRALVDEMGSPAWATDERFDTIAGRKAAEDELEAELGAWVRTQDAYDLMVRLQVRGVPAGVVQDAGDVLDRDPQLRHRGHFQQLDHPEAGRAYYDTPPVQLSRTPGALRSPAPCLGEHTEYVCRELLGLTEEERQGYQDANVFY